MRIGEVRGQSHDIGIDIGATNTKLGLVDRDGRVVARRRLLTRAEAGPAKSLERIARSVKELRGKRSVRSVGVGCAGLVDLKTGVVRVPPNLPGWHGTPVRDILAKAIGLPVRCTNDANVVTLGEWLHGAGRGCRDMFCVTLGTGVGGGAVVGGRLLLGANDAAGELGHTVIFGNGLPCRCGGRGCLERYVGAEYIVHRARQRLRAQKKRVRSHRKQMVMFQGLGIEKPSVLQDFVGRGGRRLTTKEIGRAARDGDRLALELVEEVGFYVGLGLVNAVALLDPERIVIGGGVSGLGSPLVRAARRTVLRRAQVFSGRQLEIVAAELGNDAGVVGASRLYLLPMELPTTA